MRKSYGAKWKLNSLRNKASTMKCIKSLLTGEVKRVRAEFALLGVLSGYWVYIPKSEWKVARINGSTLD